jgi:hypothetical protein
MNNDPRKLNNTPSKIVENCLAFPAKIAIKGSMTTIVVWSLSLRKTSM